MQSKDVQSKSEMKKLLELAWPISLSFLGGMSMQLVDAYFIGKLGPAAMAAVSLGNAIFAVHMIMGIGVTSSLDYLVSKDFGAKNIERCHHWLFQGLWIGLAYGVFFAILMQFGSVVFSAFGIEKNDADHAMSYLTIMGWSLIPYMAVTVLRQYLQAFGVVKPVAFILVAANILNALANWVLVFGRFGFPNMGVQGAAMATMISRIFMLALGLVFIFYWQRKNAYRIWDHAALPVKKSIRKILKLGMPIGFQMLLEIGAFASCTMLAGKLGAITLSAHQIVLHIASTTFMIPLAISSAGAVLVAQALGEGNRELATRRGWLAFKLGAWLMTAIGVIVWIFADPLIGFFTTDQEVIAIAKSLIFIVALFQIFDATQVIGSGVLRGLGSSRPSMIANLVGHWCVGVPVAALLAFKFAWGISGIWIGLSLGLIVVAVALVWIWKVLTTTRQTIP